MNLNEQIADKYWNDIKSKAILLKDLEDGCYYFGECRNADVAQWHADKKKFTYWRHEFYGDVYEEDINHFEDDNGYDLFIPYSKATKEEFDRTK